MSTNFNVGLLEGRNSSRVLKPPGGGHSQIFGGSGNEDDKPRKNMRHQNTTEINACFTHEASQQHHEEKNGFIHEKKVEHVIENVENAAPESPVEEVKQETAPPRVRVPPGGFSSGFW